MTKTKPRMYVVFDDNNEPRVTTDVREVHRADVAIGISEDGVVRLAKHREDQRRDLFKLPAPQERKLQNRQARTDDRYDRGLDWMMTATGKAFFPMEPRVGDIDIRDIAHALAFSTRFNGHTNTPLSIAEHCVHVSVACDPEDALEGLLHDAAEAYVGDVVRAVKRNLPDFQAIEHRIETVIAKAFGLQYPWPESVKRADIAVLAAERRDLMNESPFPWRTLENVVAYPDEIEGWDPWVTRERFLVRFNALTKARDR